MTKLQEGGNAFKDADRQSLTRNIKQNEIASTIAWLEKKTGLDFSNDKDEEGIPVKWTGSTGRHSESGDLDITADDKEISKEELIQKLYDSGFAKEHVKKVADGVAVFTPINGNPENGYCQTDITVGEPEWLHFSRRGGEEGGYRGEVRQILLASIAKQKGYQWSWKSGLVDRASGSATKDPNQIAKTILGQTADAKTLRSTESILDFIQKLPNYDALVADARETLSKQGVQLPESVDYFVSNKTGTPGWFRKMMNSIR